MELSKTESLQVQKLYSEYMMLLDVLLIRLLNDYENQLARRGSEWEETRQMVEYEAKKQVLIDLRKIFEKHYD